jgi:hemerythrin superfamily protein
MSIVETFTSDHREIDEQFKAYKRAKRSDSEQALEHLKSFRSQLLNHIGAEEDVLFPAYEDRLGVPPDAGLTGAMREEHRFIKQALNTLLEEFKNGEDTEETEKKLLRLLSEHNANEENRLYSELDNTLDTEKWNELLEAFELAAHEQE